MKKEILFHIRKILLWWLIIFLFLLFLWLFSAKTGISKGRDVPGLTWVEIVVLLPYALVSCGIASLSLSLLRKIYYLINSFLFFTIISSEPLPQSFAKNKNKIKR
jgi:heme/copper-type cytochrome/quinol oxidase subunit 2